MIQYWYLLVDMNTVKTCCLFPTFLIRMTCLDISPFSLASTPDRINHRPAAISCFLSAVNHISVASTTSPPRRLHPHPPRRSLAISFAFFCICCFNIPSFDPVPQRLILWLGSPLLRLSLCPRRPPSFSLFEFLSPPAIPHHGRRLHGRIRL